jgi:hypothetical protein
MGPLLIPFRGRFFGKQAGEQGRKGEQEGRRHLILVRYKKITNVSEE